MLVSSACYDKLQACVRDKRHEIWSSEKNNYRIYAIIRRKPGVSISAGLGWVPGSDTRTDRGTDRITIASTRLAVSTGTLKTRDWKKQDQICRGGKRGTTACGTRNVYLCIKCNSREHRKIHIVLFNQSINESINQMQLKATVAPV